MVPFRITPLFIAVTLSLPVSANELQRETIDLIIGGAELRPLSSPKGEIGFGLSNVLDNALRCGDVDIEDVIKASFTDAKGQVARLQSTVVSAIATATNLASAAGTILRRTYPDEYDAITNGIANVKADWGTTLNQCGQAQELLWDTSVGGPGKKESQGYAWVNYNAKAKAGEAIWTEEFTKTVGTNSGIPIGEVEKGGAGQPPVKIPKDIIDTSFDKFNLATSDPDSIGMKFYFSNKDEATKYVEELVGKSDLRFCDDCESDYTAGKGIRPAMIKEKKRVQDALNKILLNNSQFLINLTAKDYYSISYSTKVPVTSTMLSSLRNLPPSRQNRYVSSLSEEIAIANLMEKTIVARRIIQTGMRENTLKNSESVRIASKELIEALDFEIDNIERELRTSGLLRNSTSKALLMHEQLNRNSGLSEN
ncbi:hypothetical protein UA38_11740 [Photobacterium kishitanii]|uniref:Integrating conjugative element protein n=1 Tax=Photobacterium kishitanii TaxID=318456 RepID=A0AAX0YT09_9GAMM|nr:hypothetical protein [Photobacterium kishitanii]KJG57040.1 hypothetical protein UA38_11740 [Photobacterium kishitanii]KJG60564.1 hypothetical protein UA42_14525 [Photobacterium kishitanii]KJG64866.1 hypothetical protein UA40_14220 [Photobacterium kishitanii]KJG68503.1 hypothetical protein UA41_16635 [Photobacterium kishitanii]OBU31213.1 hypothetical protein AYY23_20080 [Photobacterium kishitanii]